MTNQFGKTLYLLQVKKKQKYFTDLEKAKELYKVITGGLFPMKATLIDTETGEEITSV